MKIAKSGLAALLLVGSLAGSAMAQDDGIVFKQELEPGSNYCHIQMRAIRPSTLGSDTPELKNADSADIIDFYGSCDETALGQDQVWQQTLQAHRTVGQTTIVTKAVNGVKRRASALLLTGYHADQTERR